MLRLGLRLRCGLRPALIAQRHLGLRQPRYHGFRFVLGGRDGWLLFGFEAKHLVGIVVVVAVVVDVVIIQRRFGTRSPGGFFPTLVIVAASNVARHAFVRHGVLVAIPKIDAHHQQDTEDDKYESNEIWIHRYLPSNNSNRPNVGFGRYAPLNRGKRRRFFHID